MTEFEARMAALRERFVARSGETIEAIAAHRAAGEWKAVGAACHVLAGNAGMFGFAAFGEAALAVEEAVDRGETRPQLDPLVDTLIAAAPGMTKAS